MITKFLSLLLDARAANGSSDRLLHVRRRKNYRAEEATGNRRRSGRVAT